MAARGPNMAYGGWKQVNPKVFGCSPQLSQNRCFDLSTPSMGNSHNRENTKCKMEKRIGIVTVHCCHCCRASQLPEWQPTGTPIVRAKLQENNERYRGHEAHCQCI